MLKTTSHVCQSQIMVARKGKLLHICTVSIQQDIHCLTCTALQTDCQAFQAICHRGCRTRLVGMVSRTWLYSRTVSFAWYAIHTVCIRPADLLSRQLLRLEQASSILIIKLLHASNCLLICQLPQAQQSMLKVKLLRSM